MKILAGIVAYKPDLNRLKENINAIIHQVDKVLLFANGNDTYIQASSVKNHFDSIELVRSEQNEGIAYALESIMEYATQNSYDWVYTIDQDSVSQPGLIDEYKKYINLPKAGILTCNIVDRNFKQDNGFPNGEKYREVEKCITAGSFMNATAYKHSDGYDSKMFIDGVDWDICYNLRRHGYKIYKINYNGVLQEVGHGKNVKLLWKDYITYGESPLRNYYGTRNDVYLAKKYPEYISKGKTFVREIRTEVLILLYEDQKWQKIKNRWKGINEGLKWHC